MRRTNGFTLIELLVVVTIIVVLLALLVPAMDRAIYQAELAVCGARLKIVAQAAIQYAASGKKKGMTPPSLKGWTSGEKKGSGVPCRKPRQIAATSRARQQEGGKVEVVTRVGGDELFRIPLWMNPYRFRGRGKDG